jgi:hypothetical protein
MTALSSVATKTEDDTKSTDLVSRRTRPVELDPFTLSFFSKILYDAAFRLQDRDIFRILELVPSASPFTRQIADVDDICSRVLRTGDRESYQLRGLQELVAESIAGSFKKIFREARVGSLKELQAKQKLVIESKREAAKRYLSLPEARDSKIRLDNSIIVAIDGVLDDEKAGIVEGYWNAIFSSPDGSLIAEQVDQQVNACLNSMVYRSKIQIAEMKTLRYERWCNVFSEHLRDQIEEIQREASLEPGKRVFFDYLLLKLNLICPSVNRIVLSDLYENGTKLYLQEFRKQYSELEQRLNSEYSELEQRLNDEYEALSVSLHSAETRAVMEVKIAAIRRAIDDVRERIAGGSETDELELLELERSRLVTMLQQALNPQQSCLEQKEKILLSTQASNTRKLERLREKITTLSTNKPGDISHDRKYLSLVSFLPHVYTTTALDEDLLTSFPEAMTLCFNRDEFVELYFHRMQTLDEQRISLFAPRVLIVPVDGGEE